MNTPKVLKSSMALKRNNQLLESLKRLIAMQKTGNLSDLKLA
jgi:hypothetical protein